MADVRETVFTSKFFLLKGLSMKVKSRIPLSVVLCLCATFYGCAVGAPSTNQANDASSKVEKKNPDADNSTAEKKISMAIGQEVGRFKIADQQKADAPTGFNGVQHTVKTQTGETFKCEILEPSGVGKLMSLGMPSGASAMCTDFTVGSTDQGKTNKANCNALLKAAGKC